ncbi:TRAP transporter permease [Chloroflexota bacterium]
MAFVMRRRGAPLLSWLFKGWCIAFILFQLGTSGLGLLPDMQQRVVHVMFAFVIALAVTLRPKETAAGKLGIVITILMMGLTIVATVNVYFNYIRFTFNPLDSTPVDLVLGTAIILIALEASRRTVGWVFPILVALVLLYAVFGYVIPGTFGYPGLNPVYLVQMLYQSSLGAWGPITGLSATVLSIFLIFGSLLIVTGGAQTFIDIATFAAGRFRGGPALVAVISSALFGSLSGSCAANVAVTGNFTIPLMKRLGYESTFAGGVEAAASNGGNIMPPVMGAGAFIMAEILGIPYIQVVIAAFVPAFLFFFSIGFAVRFKALRMDLAAVPADELPKASDVFQITRVGHIIIPFITLIVFLLMGYTVTRVGFSAWLLSLVLFLVLSGLRPTIIKERLRTVLDSFFEAAYTIARITPLLVSANIVVSLLNSTGLALKLSHLISLIAADYLVPTIILAAVICLFFGMILPAVIAYVLAAAILAPALIPWGFLPLALHMFLYYYSCLGAITPPVCIASFVASTIAKASWLKISWQSMRLSIVAFLIPFIFLIQPYFLLQGPTGEIVLAITTAVLGIACLASGTYGYLAAKLKPVSRIMMVASGILLIIPSALTGLWGMALLALVILGNSRSVKLAIVKVWKSFRSDRLS